MQISRRTFLYYSGPFVALPLLPKQCSEIIHDYVAREPPFRHGLASGDPTPDAVVLWTRVTGDAGAPPFFGVVWCVATDAELRHVVKRGVTSTSSELDFTVKVDVSGLAPGTTYYYAFEALGHASSVGRTRTLPVGRVDRLRFAVASCSNYPYGFFNAYRKIAERADLDVVLHLGDYLYEYANAEYGDGTPLGRVPSPDREILTLSDYRTRHAQYKTDPDLQEAHRQHPFIAVWDDHESANNAFRNGAENHDPLTEGEWALRRAAATRAYFEWMPIRGIEVDGMGRVYRAFPYGGLLDLVMLDTRLIGRDEQIADACDATSINDPTRQLLGETQETWLVERLGESQRRRTRWRVVGQQVMFAQLVDVLSSGNCVFNTDQWDGYPAARSRVLTALSDHGIDNLVMLTGDIHSSWANDVTANPFDPSLYDAASGAGSVAVEFVTPAVTSPGIDDPAEAQLLAQVIGQTHPHIHYVELNRRGYLVLDVTPERIQAEWYHVATISERAGGETLAAVFGVLHGNPHVVAMDGASIPVGNPPLLAPLAGVVA